MYNHQTLYGKEIETLLYHHQLSNMSTNTNTEQVPFIRTETRGTATLPAAMQMRLQLRGILEQTTKLDAAPDPELQKYQSIFGTFYWLLEEGRIEELHHILKTSFPEYYF